MEQVICSDFPPPRHRARKARRNRGILLCLLLGLSVDPALFCQETNGSIEYQVKAAFLLNFTKFVEWPVTAFRQEDSPVSICILGVDPFGGGLDQILSGELVNGRKVVAQRIKSVPPPQVCQALFVSRPEKDIGKILPGLGPGVLTVGEGESFIRDGGMIAFVIENRRVRFEINQASAENAGLKLSSKLLSVAKQVQQ
jgi:YfiR/HmsC-like